MGTRRDGLVRTALVAALALTGAGCSSGGTHAAVVPSSSTASPPVTAPPLTAALPPHWTGYHGTSVPLSVGVPPGWQVDEGTAAVGEISFASPVADSAARITFGRRQLTTRPPSVALLLNRLVSASTRQCESGRTLAAADPVVASSLSFATAIATCPPEKNEPGEGDETTAFFMGATLTRTVEWTFVFRDHADDLARDRRQVMSRMLTTLALPA